MAASESMRLCHAMSSTATSQGRCRDICQRPGTSQAICYGNDCRCTAPSALKGKRIIDVKSCGRPCILDDINVDYKTKGYQTSAAISCH